MRRAAPGRRSQIEVLFGHRGAGYRTGTAADQRAGHNPDRPPDEADKRTRSRPGGGTAGRAIGWIMTAAGQASQQQKYGHPAQ